MTALTFAELFFADTWANNKKKRDRSPGKKALAGHAILRRLIASGVVRRIEGASPSSDLFVVSRARRHSMGRTELRRPRTPMTASSSTKHGYAVHVRKEVLGPIAMPPAAPQTLPQVTQEQIYEQFCAWAMATLPEVRAIKTLLSEALNWRRLDGSPIYELRSLERIGLAGARALVDDDNLEQRYALARCPRSDDFELALGVLALVVRRRAAVGDRDEAHGGLLTPQAPALSRKVRGSSVVCRRYAGSSVTTVAL